MRGRLTSAVAPPHRAAVDVAAFVLLVTTLARGQAPETVPATPLPTEPTASPAPAAPSEPAASEPSPQPNPAAKGPPSAAGSAPDTAVAVPELPVDSESAALVAELIAASMADSEQPSLDLYGFADFTFVTRIGKRTIGPPQPSFAIGNVNVYLASRISERLRSLVEVRFLYLPHGTVPTAQPGGPRSDTTAPDPADVNRPLRWGSIELERVWVEYDLSQELTLRIGQWLSPYGIWNVDHGSPVFIPTIRPYVIGDGLIPERQTGVEAYGSVFVDATQIGYHLTVSNGRGPIDAYQDLDANKGLGGRLFVSNGSLIGTLTLGVSGYRGTYTDRPEPLVIFDLEEGLIPNDAVSLRYREQALAADLKWEWNSWLLQSEFVVSDVAYDDAARPSDPGRTGGPPGFAADQRRIGGYGLLGYRTPWWGTMPYVLVSMYDNGLVRNNWAFIGGLNVRSTPNLVLKVEYTKVVFLDDDLPGYQQLLSQVAWSF